MPLGAVEANMIIYRYRTAFQEANGCEVECAYKRGWFSIRHLGAAVGTKHRRKEIEEFTRRLRARKEAARKQEQPVK